jgi:hypothetical protein
MNIVLHNPILAANNIIPNTAKLKAIGVGLAANSDILGRIIR